MEQPDPFERLASLAPDAGPLEAGDDPVADATLARILERPASSPPEPPRALHRSRRRWVVPVVVAGAVGIGGVAAAAVLISRRPVDPTQLACLRTASVGSDAYVVDLDPEESVRDLCAPGWLDGTFGTDGPPEFTACVDKAGFAYAVPNTDDQSGTQRGSVCSRLGYVDYDPTPDVEADAIRTATDAIAELNDAEPDRCIELDQARTLYRDVLDKLGFRDWAFTTDGYVYTESNPCIQVAFLRDRHLIGLPGVPRPG